MDEWQNNIAHTMAQQLGGNKFKVATGSKLYAGVNALEQVEITAKLPSDIHAKQGIKTIKVAYYEGLDTYIMSFLNAKNQIIKKYESVFCDDLIPFFEEETGVFILI